MVRQAAEAAVEAAVEAVAEAQEQAAQSAADAAAAREEPGGVLRKKAGVRRLAIYASGGGIDDVAARHANAAR